MTNPCGTTISAVPSLKGTAAKYSCVGSALKVAIPSKCIHNANSSTVLNTGPPKRTEKFSIKNVSKVSKIFKVSNLSYKIKPVLKSASNLDCPIIYVGEPAFVDIEDFTDPVNEDSNGLIQNNESSGMKIQTSDIEWAGSMPTAYATSMVQSARVLPSSHGAAQGVYPERGPSMISPTNPTGRVPWTSPYSFPPFITTHEKLHEKKTPIVNALPQWKQGQNATFQHGTAFRIVARPAVKPVTSDIQNIVQKIDLSAVKPTIIMPPVVAKPVTKPITITKNFASSSVSIGTTKSTPHVTSVTSVKTKKAMSQTTVKKKKLAPSTMKVVVPGISSSTPGVKVNIYPACASPTKLGSKDLPNKSAISKPDASVFPAKSAGITPTVSILPEKSVSNTLVSILPKKSAGKPTLATVVTTLYKNASTVYVKALNTSKVIPTANTTNHSTKMTAKVHMNEKSNKESVAIGHGRGLRAGVEISFEDGVRHFITSLKQVTHLDDEPVRSWSELKKGAKIAAPWLDGQIYDATVIACYFPTSKIMQPVVALETLPIKDSKSKAEQPKTKSTGKMKSVPTAAGKKVGCTRCKKVFLSIVDFREHQRLECNSTGVIVPNSASKVTDKMISAIMKGDKNSAKSDFKMQSPALAASPLQPKSAKRSAPKDSPASATSPPHSKSVKRSNSNDADTPPHKKAKTMPKSQTTTDNTNEAIFKKGTKFLHRWQLDGGESRWYQGEVQGIMSNKGSFLNWEFEVSYKGEDDNYVLKLYEDFPTDIRIIGKL